MRTFEDEQEVDEWLEPLDYETFWAEIDAYPVTLQPRDHCDEQIAKGLVDESLVLRVLKGLARRQIAAAQNLPRRLYTPPLTMH